MSLAAARLAVAFSISSSEALQLSLRAFVKTKKKLIVYGPLRLIQNAFY